MRPARPLILGHRGDPGRGRENTIASLQRAIAAGADGVEFDLRRTQDSLVVHHDAAVRIRGRRHRLASMASNQLPSWLPAAADVVRWAKGNDALLDVEIKEPGTELEAWRAFAPVRNRCTFTSFHPDVVYALRKISSHVRVGWISKSEPDAIMAVAAELRPGIMVLPARRCSVELLAGLSDLECGVWAWNVNSARTANRLRTLGVSAFITDVPGTLSAWRGGPAPPRKVPRTGRRGS